MAEIANLKEDKEVPQVNLMMRWADGGDPATLYLLKHAEEYILDIHTGVRKIQNHEVAVTPEFTESMPIGSIINLGEGQTFLVSLAPNKVTQEQFPESVFVKRIPMEDKIDKNGKKIEGFATLNQRFQAEGHASLVYSKDKKNIPYTKKTIDGLQGTKCQL